MERTPNNFVSRDIVRAIFETRDHRHNETHAMLLTIFQMLVAELVEQGSLAPRPLADRLARAEVHIADDPHGMSARDMLAHVLTWLRSMEPGLPPVLPLRWFAPLPATPEDSTQ